MLRRAPRGSSPKPISIWLINADPAGEAQGRGRVPLAEQLGADMNAARIALDDDDLAARDDVGRPQHRAGTGTHGAAIGLGVA
jgi:hypothetical protein